MGGWTLSLSGRECIVNFDAQGYGIWRVFVFFGTICCLEAWLYLAHSPPISLGSACGEAELTVFLSAIVRYEQRGAGVPGTYGSNVEGAEMS